MLLIMKFWNMSYSDISDDDYGDLFITQQSKVGNSVLLEDSNDDFLVFKSVMDPQYSDVSDVEEVAHERRLR